MNSLLLLLVEAGSADTPDQFQALHTSQQQLLERITELENSKDNVELIQKNVTKALQLVSKERCR